MHTQPPKCDNNMNKMTKSNNSNPLGYFSAYKSNDGSRNISKINLLMNCGSSGLGGVVGCFGGWVVEAFGFGCFF